MIPGGPLGAGSSVPSPGGDVSGAIGSLTVAKIDGRALALNGQGGAPALDDGDLLVWNAGGSAWIPSGIGEPFQFYTFAGRNGAGAITVTGATIGWVTKMCLTISGGALEGQTNNFEAAISVTDQIQQTSGLDLSALTYFLILQKS